MNNYSDIIDIKYPIKLKHSRMSINMRASIFAPFSALSGFGESINEIARETANRIELEENKKELINYKLNEIKNNGFKDELEIKYFIDDKYKEGGEYLSTKSKIKKIDIYNNIIILIDKTKIRLDNIIDIN